MKKTFIVIFVVFVLSAFIPLNAQVNPEKKIEPVTPEEVLKTEPKDDEKCFNENHVIFDEVLHEVYSNHRYLTYLTSEIACELIKHKNRIWTISSNEKKIEKLKKEIAKLKKEIAKFKKKVEKVREKYNKRAEQINKEHEELKKKIAKNRNRNYKDEIEKLLKKAEKLEKERKIYNKKIKEEEAKYKKKLEKLGKEIEELE